MASLSILLSHKPGNDFPYLDLPNMGKQLISHSQANICHAYQILKKGGLKDENIIVFMYDDIAHASKTLIINKPKGHDVYKGILAIIGDLIN
ncbi:unnamed protein product [Prunus armeniaca]